MISPTEVIEDVEDSWDATGLIIGTHSSSESTLEYKAVPEIVNSLSKLFGSLKFAGRYKGSNSKPEWNSGLAVVFHRTPYDQQQHH